MKKQEKIYFKFYPSHYLFTFLILYIYIYIYIYIVIVLVVTISFCGFVVNQMQYNLESVQYLS